MVNLVNDYCCCGYMHVRTGALVIGVLAVLGGIVEIIISSAVRGMSLNIIACVIFIITGGFNIFADRTERAWGYLPYIILTGLSIIGYALVAIIAIIIGIVVPQGMIDSIRNVDKDDDLETIKKSIRIIYFIYAAVIIIGEVFAIWFWSVVYRAYKYMRDVVSGGTN